VTRARRQAEEPGGQVPGNRSDDPGEHDLQRHDVRIDDPFAHGRGDRRRDAEELELYEEPTLMAELRRLSHPLRSRPRAAVVNPRSGDSHGDVAQALVLAFWGQRRWRSDLGGGARADSSGPLDWTDVTRILDARDQARREAEGERVGRRFRRIGPA
jgi:hypothetical protein